MDDEAFSEPASILDFFFGGGLPLVPAAADCPADDDTEHEDEGGAVDGPADVEAADDDSLSEAAVDGVAQAFFSLNFFFFGAPFSNWALRFAAASMIALDLAFIGLPAFFLIPATTTASMASAIVSTGNSSWGTSSTAACTASVGVVGSASFTSVLASGLQGPGFAGFLLLALLDFQPFFLGPPFFCLDGNTPLTVLSTSSDFRCALLI